MVCMSCGTLRVVRRRNSSLPAIWLDPEEQTWLILPFELWLLDEWKAKYHSNEKICVELRRSLYGHPMAGKWWQDHLHQRLLAIGAQEIPMFPSNCLFICELDGNQYTLLLNVYVDDLSLCGHRSCHKPFWAKLRETVKIEEETFIDDSNCVLILGRRHFIQRQEDRTRCVFDMRPYTEGVVDAYCEMTGFEEVTIETSKEMLEVSSWGCCGWHGSAVQTSHSSSLG